MLNRKFVALSASLAMLLAACGGSAATPAAPTAAASAASTVTAEPSEAQASDSAPANARTVTVEIGDGKITPASVSVKKGEIITFVAKNVTTGEVELIVGLQKDVAGDSGDSLKEAEQIPAGGSKSVNYTFDGDGPFAFGDQVGDHYAKGAKGDIVVQP